MRRLRAWLSRVVGFVRPGRGERDFDAELDSHLELHVADELRAGCTPDEARRRALAALGSVAAVREAQREQRGLPLLDSLGQDLQYAVRGLRRRPGFAAACIATLALGIGANSAIFSVVQGVLLAPLPYRAPDQLLALWIENPALGRGPGPMAGADVRELRESLTTVSGVEGFQTNVIPIAVGSGGDAVDAQAVLVSPAFSICWAATRSLAAGCATPIARAPWSSATGSGSVDSAPIRQSSAAASRSAAARSPSSG